MARLTGKIQAGMPRGGSGLGYDPFALGAQKHAQDLEKMRLQAEMNAAQANMMQQQQPRSPSVGAQMGNSIATGAGAAIGAAIPGLFD
jgi:hypothetical protein